MKGNYKIIVNGRIIREKVSLAFATGFKARWLSLDAGDNVEIVEMETAGSEASP